MLSTVILYLKDIVDALGAHRPATDRLRHIAHIGVTTFAWSFANRQMAVPTAPIHVALSGPSGDLWTWGPENAENVVRGPAEDFCLVVTRRRHVADTALHTKTEAARQWMQIAQAFAGPPVNGPEAGRFAAKRRFNR